MQQPLQIQPELDAMHQLKKLAELQGAGIVSEEGFQAKKKQLLAI
jgi:hypothetical protein